ncbi:TonB-dependent receptor plug domain-containing protein [Sphingobium scionense]
MRGFPAKHPDEGKATEIRAHPKGSDGGSQGKTYGTVSEQGGLCGEPDRHGVGHDRRQRIRAGRGAGGGWRGRHRRRRIADQGRQDQRGAAGHGHIDRRDQERGAVSGDELFRSIPQFGDVQFNSQYLPGSSNGARGDIGSLDLRSLGIGNTLVLLNGRRVVAHPTSQANDQLVPVLSYNTNAIPVNGLERLEVLRDGAAAIYGADAVAGVVNTVLKTNYQGAELSLQYGGAEGTGLREFNGNGVIGTNFAENRGNITLFGSYDHGTGLDSTEQYYTESSDKRGLFEGTAFEGSTSLDGTGRPPRPSPTCAPMAMCR